MGVLNLTPDSFSDGGRYTTVSRALKRAADMVREGVDIIDVGGESTGPGSSDVSLKSELERVIPLIKKLHTTYPRLTISVDTYKAEVARQAVAAGARMINDVTALRGDEAMVSVVAESGVPLVMMYSKDTSARTTRTKRRYVDVVKTVKAFLEERVRYARAQGVAKEQLILDPGMGAFVSGLPQYSYEILARLDELAKLGYPILVGASRKSFLGGPLEERLIPTLVAHTVALQNGASIVRVHDVKEHRQLLTSLRSSSQWER
ncbi:dihydropteroate synthase [Candidatus Peregrinibacteria bacterium CG_4_9_14_0_2_um_filter_53_11]|nr:MAG: dihydropteroate synthase [Candidatus Peregrinibacteria bacterium CG_4_9_14_0_2_um_filter_53_11]